jgi:hypothetical protein
MQGDFIRTWHDVTDRLTQRLRAVENNSRSEVTGAVVVSTVAALPAAGQVGRLLFASDGRKVGEGVGAGTGVLVYDDGVAWRRTSDDSTVAA